MAKLIIIFLLVTAGNGVCAAEQEVGAQLVSQAFQIIFALVFVICLIVFLAMLVRKHNLFPSTQAGAIKILATTNLSGNEKLHLVQVGDDQILLGQGGNGINKLHRLSVKIHPADQLESAGGVGFQQIFGRHFTKGIQSDGEHNV